MEQRDPYWRGRWDYISIAIDYVRQVKPDTALEIGPGTQPILFGSARMDVAPGYDYVHDATEFPWPIEDDSFDLLMALQVWEHLGDAQERAFAEVMRIADAAVLSFPYKWTKGCSARHIGIDLETIERWTCGVVPEGVSLVGPKGRQRVVMIWRFR